MNTPIRIASGPAGAAWTLVLAHGAGQGMDSPFLNHMAAAISARGRDAGGIRVLRFEFPYMEATRRDGRRRPPDREPALVEAWRGIITSLDGVARARLAIGGKSLGGRIASMVADEEGVAGLVCLGYPFHPPGRPQALRTAHLETLCTPALICQGSRDPFGRRDEVAGYRLAPAIRMHWADDGDHGLRPRKSSGRTEEQNLDEAAEAVAAFLAGLPAG